MSVAEDHYVLSPPDLIERCSGGTRTRLPTARWTDLGEGRLAAAALLLTDATGNAHSQDLIRAFVSDLLVPHPAAQPLALAVREVRAWRAEREPEIERAAAERAAAAASITLPALLAQRDAELAGGPRAPWLTFYRTVHGPPTIDHSHPREEAG